jgi:protein-S-isoprenylcysteine O-methyltransferase Ste14
LIHNFSLITANDRKMNNQPGPITPMVIVRLLLIIIFLAFLPLIISRQWTWWEAWVYALIYILGFTVSRLLAARRYPDLIAERARFMQHEGAKPWDRCIVPLLGLLGGIILMVAGLDALFGWSPPFCLPAKMISLAFILAGNVLGSYALIENPFFSGLVRIQTERGHQVVSSGPYRWLRHPGYAGAILIYLDTPVFLDSLWAFIPAGLIAGLFIYRTALEDRVLQAELAGYEDYAEQVPYRLLPGIW